MVNIYNQGVTVPVAYVTKGRQRVKQYNKSVYLNNNDEFEIELFNPTQGKVMAKIDLNGTSIGPGIVLRPGQRVFLERYINDAKKFLFTIYEVDGGNADVQRAIANNGKISVKFYKEEVPVTVTYNPNPIWTITTPWYGTGGTCYYNHTSFGDNVKANDFASGQYNGSISFAAPAASTFTSPSQGRKISKSANVGGGTISANASDGKLSASSFYMSSEPENVFGFCDTYERSFVAEPTKNVETGRIEQGSASSQSFGHDYSNFQYYYTWSTEWQILPMSQKPVSSEDIKVYCGKCGAKRKRDSDNFCPKCGTKY